MKTTLVEVFKTNVSCVEAACALVQELQYLFPGSQINFDLEDCDKILRIEATEIDHPIVIELFKQRGFLCESL